MPMITYGLFFAYSPGILKIQVLTKQSLLLRLKSKKKGKKQIGTNK